MTNRGQEREQILTLHQESAQQLLCGHRFDFCPQVDVSSYHQGRSPEAQDPAGHGTPLTQPNIALLVTTAVSLPTQFLL